MSMGGIPMMRCTFFAGLVLSLAAPITPLPATVLTLPATPRGVPVAGRLLSVARMAGIVHGQIVDKDGGAPVAGAAVTVDGTTIGGTTDDRGNFRLTGVPAGDRSLSVRRI